MPKSHSATQSIVDPWGNLHECRIVWRELPLKGLSNADDNFGVTEVAFTADDCPAHWILDPATSCARLIAPPRSYSKDIRMDVQPFEIDPDQKLLPGGFHVYMVHGDR